MLLPAALHNNEFGWWLLVKTHGKKQEKRALAQNLKSQPEIMKKNSVAYLWGTANPVKNLFNF